MTDAPDSSPVMDVIARRRSLRAFAPRPLPDELLRVLFEAVRWAPSSGNGQPWRFVVTRQGSEAFQALAATLRSGNSWARDAAVLVLVAAKTVHDAPGKPVRPNRRALLDLGLGLENLLLEATRHGVVSHPMAGFDAAQARRVARVDGPFEVAVLVALGYPGDPERLEPEFRAKDRRPRERFPQSAFVFEGSWGEAARWTSDDDA